MSDQKPPPAPQPLPSETAATATSPADAFDRAGPRKTIDKIPRNFGRYRLKDCLGRGGMGAVFKADDTQLDRQVALKVPFLSDDDADTRARFYREARAAATLQHAYICPVFDVGEFSGIPYLTMAFIEGRSLAQALKAGVSYTPTQAALLTRKIALGMQEAHSKGVVHRDLKPANILLRPNGEPVIMDFGLARRADDRHSHGLTQEGDIIGTLDYMSPEQVEGENTTVGPPADIYSLGLILYELLCGRRPFEGNTASLLVQIVTKEPTPPSHIRSGIPPRIEEICLKAMAKKPADRFASMTQFSAALAEFLRNPQMPAQSPVARPPATPPATPAVSPAAAETSVTPKTRPLNEDGERSTARSAARSSKRSRSARRKKKSLSPVPFIVAGVGALLLIGIAAAVTIIVWPRGDKSSAAATTPETPVNPGPAIPPHAGSLAGPAQGIPPMPPNRAGGGPGNNSRPPVPPNTPDPSGGGPASPGPAKPSNTPGFAVRIQPTEPTLAVGQAKKITLHLERKDYQGPVSLRWAAPKELRVEPAGPVTVRPGQPDPVLTLTVLAEPAGDMRLEITATHDQEQQRGEVKTALTARADPNGPCSRVVILSVKPNFTIESIVFAPDLTVALIGGGAGSQERPGGAPGGGPGGPPPPGGGIPPPGGGPPPGQDRGGQADEANAIQICNLQQGATIGTLAGHKDRVLGLVISADSKTALSFAADDTVALWDVAHGKVKKMSPKLTYKVHGAAIFPDAHRGLLIAPGALVKVNLDTFQPLGKALNTMQLSGSNLPDLFRTVAVSETKGLIGGLEGKLFLLDYPEKGRAAGPKALTSHTEAVLSSAFSPLGDLAATGGGGTLKAGALQPGADNAVRLWDVAGGSLKWKGDGHTQSVTCIAFSGNGKLLASGSADGLIKVWNAENGAVIATLPGHSGKVLALAFAPDGRTLWSGAADKTLRLWRLP